MNFVKLLSLISSLSAGSARSARSAKGQPSHIQVLPVYVSDRVFLIPSGASCLYVRMGIGTPSQNFSMYLDTGGNTSWVPSSKCSQQKCRNMTRYYSSKSTSYKANGTRGVVEYIFGKVPYFLSQDTVSVGEWKIAEQVFAEATDLRGLMRFFHSNQTAVGGILGLPPSRLDGTTPPLLMAYKQGLMKKPIFGFAFHKSAANSERNEFVGEMIIGGRDISKFRGKLEYVRLRQNFTFWEVQPLSFQFNNKTYKISQNEYATIDTGYPGIQVPIPYQELAKAFNMTGYTPVLDCSKLSKYPKLSINLNGAQLDISAENYVAKSGNTCFCLLSYNSKHWFLGNPVHMPYYVEYDFREKRIGFGKMKHSTGK